MRLKDKVCIVTGGAAGIGKATAQKFASEGAQVVICDVNAELGQALANELGNTHIDKQNKKRNHNYDNQHGAKLSLKLYL